MRIGKKLYYGFGAVLAIVLLLFVVNLSALLRERSTLESSTNTLESKNAIEAVRFQMMQNRLFLRNYLLSGDGRDVERFNKGVDDLFAVVKNTLGKTASPELQKALNRVEELERAWLDEFGKPLIDKRKQVDEGNATVADLQIFYLQKDPNAWLKKSTQPLDDADDAIRKEVEASRRSSSTAGMVALVVCSLGTLLALALGIGVAYFTANSIVRPLHRLIEAAREIGESGDLDQKLDIESRDEIGELAGTFEKMVSYLKEMAGVSEAIAQGDLTVKVQPRSDRDTLANAFQQMEDNLRALVRQVRDNAAQVASGSTQIASASDESAKLCVQSSSAIDEVTSTMHEMSVNVQSMVKNTQGQASSVSETSASIDQMVASIQRVADMAKLQLDISDRSRQEAQNGIQTMETAIDGLNRINTAILSSSEIIATLGQRTDDIGKIVGVIDDQAEQTNLLALNAAIEAARAGEHGQGFAVVADEVRKLAEKSAQSTREISELIGSIQKEARKAVDNMEKSTAIVQESRSLGNDLHAALKKIFSVVTEVYKFAQEIGSATNEQSHGSTQIAKATMRLNEITHEINSAVEEQASGAQGVVRAMERMRDLVQQSTSSTTELAASSEQMSKMSRALLNGVDRFTIERTRSNGNGHSTPHRRDGEVDLDLYDRPAAALRN